MHCQIFLSDSISRTYENDVDDNFVVAGVVTSDHKPVWGMFEVRIRPGKDSVPLAGGLFNRQVYLEGLKRRSESLKPIIGKGGSANMCNVS